MSTVLNAVAVTTQLNIQSFEPLYQVVYKTNPEPDNL
jgi:hypothetical protein